MTIRTRPSPRLPGRVHVGAGDDVEVYLLGLDADDDAVGAAEAVLTPDEVGRARRGTAAVRRRRVLLRAALRRVLAAETGIPPARVPLATAPGGRPHVALPGAGLHVSCSASGSLGMVALARRRVVGADLERTVPWSAGVLDEGWLSPGERHALTLLPPGARPVAATRAWTRKEAVLKARGTGLRDDPAAVVTGMGRTAAPVAGWTLHDVPVPDGWVASLAVAPDEESPR